MPEPNNDISKWAGVGMAFLAAAGGYIGSVSSKSESDGILKSQVQTIQSSIHDHDAREREFEQTISTKLTDIEARVRVLEARK